MRSISSLGQAALDSGIVARRNALWFDVGAGYGFWDDIYDVVIDSRTYAGRAGRFTMSALPSVGDQRVQGLQVEFPGVDGSIYQFIAEEAWHQQPMLALLILMDPVNGAIIDARPWFSGFIDTAPIRERPDGNTTLRVNCESTSRALDRKGTQTRSEASQRRIDATDGFFKHLGAADTAEIYWGRTPPATASGVAGNSSRGSYRL